jgi:GntR family transcriptional regulator
MEESMTVSGRVVLAAAPALKKNLPLYKRIADDLLDKITSGAIPVGEVLPAEDDLGLRYEASRGTIRQALTLLQELGVILRRQREGTRIISRYPSMGRVDNKQMLEDWARYAMDYPLQIASLSFRLPPEDDDGKPIGEEKWLCIAGIRYPVGSQVPISFCQSFVHPDFADIESSLQRTSIPVFAQVEERYGRTIVAVRQSLRALSLPEDIAAKLGAAANEPALELKRYYLDHRRETIIVAVNTHPAERYTHTVEVERGAT